MSKIDNYRAVALAEGFEEGTEEEVVAAWQYLHDSRLAYQLQGFFGRTAQAMIADGVISDRAFKQEVRMAAPDYLDRVPPGC